MSFNGEYPPGLFPRDLVEWWDFHPSNNLRGRINNTLLTNSNTTFANVNVHDGYYGTFNATSSVLNAGNPAYLNNMSQFTLECWINAAGQGEGGNGRIITKESGAGTWTFQLAANASLAFSIDYDGATPALDASLGSVFTLSAAGNRTIAVPSNPVTGQKIVIAHTASGGARTLALNTGTGGFRLGSDIAAITETASGKTDYIGAIYNATDNKWDVVAFVKGF